MRFPTPFRKDMKALKKKAKGKYKPHATPSTTIFRKGNSSQDDLTLLSVTSTGDQSFQSDMSPSTLDRREMEEVCGGYLMDTSVLHVHTCACACVCMCMCVCVCMHMCVCVHILCVLCTMYMLVCAFVHVCVCVCVTLMLIYLHARKSV